MSLFDWVKLLFAALGFLLCVLLLSCHRQPMRLARAIMAAPVSVYNINVSLSTVVVAMFGIMSYVYYFQFRQWSDNHISQKHLFLAEAEKHLYKSERNLSVSLLGLVLWCIAWRLKSLSLGAAANLRHHDSLLGARQFSGGKLFWGVMAVASFVAADVPMCRVNYSLQLAAVSREKQAIVQMADECRDVFNATATGHCRTFCDRAALASAMRSEAVDGARKWHLMGKLAAQLFDGARGVVQGAERQRKLFEDKTCADVLASVDKSNASVNGFCWIAAVVVSMAFVISVTKLFGGEGRGAEFAMPEPSAPPEKKVH